MNNTETISIDLKNIDAESESLIIIIQLMMACNDLKRANHAHSYYKKNESSEKQGQSMYFSKLELGHLFEGLKVIEKINGDSSLVQTLEECDDQTKESFNFLKNFLPGGSKRKDLMQWVGKVRHNLTFHYSGCNKLINNALEKRKKGTGSSTSSVTRGSIKDLWHFKLADDLLDSIVCREIWKIPDNKNIGEEAEKILKEIHAIVLKFADFSGEFIWNYFEKKTPNSNA